MPITTALTRTEGGLTSDNVICPCVNRQKAHGWPGVARPKSWDRRCAELTASAEEPSNRRANKPASADFATKVFRSSCKCWQSNKPALPAQGLFSRTRCGGRISLFEPPLSETPSTKPQAPEKFQISNPENSCRGQRRSRPVFELGAWFFFGAWNLELGACCLGSWLLKN